MLRTFILPIREVIQETSDAISLIIAQPLVDRIPYLPGQHLTLKVLIDGHAYYRTYSLSSTPRLDRHLSLTIKRVKGGKVSNYLNEHAAPGQLLEFLRPVGNFYLDTETSEHRHVVLIGGGSGITPLMSMLRAALFHEPYSKVSLLYGSRKLEETLFRTQLEAFSQTFPDRFSLGIWLSGTSAPHSAPYHTGRIQPADIQHLLQHSPFAALPCTYYLCGPAGLMDMARQTLLDTGIAAEAIHEERFVPDSSLLQNQKALEGPTRTVEITMGDTTQRVQVPPGVTILQAALAQGLDLPYSCRQGVCAACMSRLLDGEVDMDNPEALLDFEREEGKVLTCQAHPSTDGVRIRVGN